MLKGPKLFSVLLQVKQDRSPIQCLKPCFDEKEVGRDWGGTNSLESYLCLVERRR